MQDGDKNSSLEDTRRELDGDEEFLVLLEHRKFNKTFNSIEALHDVLRRATTMLHRSKKHQIIIIHHLVDIPFAIFTNEAIKLGVSLWLGIINENPLLGSIVLSEIAQCWERTVRNRMGVFSKKLS